MSGEANSVPYTSYSVLKYCKAGQGQPGRDNLHSILSLDEGRNPVGGVYSIHSSFLSSLLARHNSTFIRETGMAATTRDRTAGLQAYGHLYCDEGLFSGGWGDTAAPQGLYKHRRVLLEGLCWEAKRRAAAQAHTHSVGLLEGQFQEVR